jgi:hypothetical protein
MGVAVYTCVSAEGSIQSRAERKNKALRSKWKAMGTN